MDNLTPGDTEGQTIVQEEATGEISEESSDKFTQEKLQHQDGESVSGSFADPAETEKADSKEIEGDEHLNVNKLDLEESKVGESNVEDIEKEEEIEPVAMLDEAESANETKLSNNEEQTAVETEPEEAKEEDAWLDILGNGLLKKKVEYLVRVLFCLLPW